MRIAALALLLLGLAGCAPGAAPGSAGAFTASLWPDPQVSRDVAAIRTGMDAARVGADSMAARRTP